MIRMQIQLDPATRDALRKRAFAEGKSLSAVARAILRDALDPRRTAGESPLRGVRDLFPFVGIVRNDTAPIAENHDDHAWDDGP
jgi:plasmid stability protein